jgi:type II secretory pathway pseudopilin PulG
MNVKSVKTLKALKRGECRVIRDKGTVSNVEGRLALRRLAFSLIEIMVTIALLSFIVLGLLAMFNQTQKAFRSSMTQVDVLEAGRAVTDMIARDIESMVASELPDSPSNALRTLNFFAELSPNFPQFTQPILQGLPGTVGLGGPGTQECRTNVFYDVFVLAKQNLDYIGIGYQVRPEYQNGVYGTLYRFATNRTKGAAVLLSAEFRGAEGIQWTGNTTPTNMSRIADGVVHFEVKAYDTNGCPFNYNTSYTNAMFRTNGYVQASGIGSGFVGMRNSHMTKPSAAVPDRFNYYFYSNAVPAYLELEVGFLEPHILDRLKGIGNAQAQYQYLSNHVANVHLFRRRIPIRNVDFLAYQ